MPSSSLNKTSGTFTEPDSQFYAVPPHPGYMDAMVGNYDYQLTLRHNGENKLFIDENLLPPIGISQLPTAEYLSVYLATFIKVGGYFKFENGAELGKDVRIKNINITITTEDINQ